LRERQIFQKFIHHQQHAVIGMNLRKRGHHFLESGLVVDHPVGGREGEFHPAPAQEAFEFAGHDIAQRHAAGDLTAMDLEFTGNGACRRGDLGMPEQWQIAGILGDK